MTEGYKKYLKKLRIKNALIIFVQILIIVVFLISWQIFADKQIINTFLLSSPKKVFNTIVNLINQNNFWNHIFITLQEIILSFILGNLIGLFISTILWFNKFLSKVLDPFFTILNSLPKVALGPLIIVWAGANMKSIIIMALLISTVISIINTNNAFKNTNVNMIKLIKSMGASNIQIFKYVIFPANVTSIIDSFKLNISMCFVGVIMGELLVSKEGIGYLIIYGSQVFNMNMVITGVVLLVMMTIILYIIINFIDKKIKRN